MSLPIRLAPFSRCAIAIGVAANATGAAAQNRKSAAETLGLRTEQLRQMDDFLATIRAA
jgi:hypothetical protein